jgi:hypothetical protein
MASRRRPFGKRARGRAPDQNLHDGAGWRRAGTGGGAARSLRGKSRMPIPRCAPEVLLASLVVLAGGCAPEVLAMNVGNPARGGDVAGAMQSYEVPPYREDHRYEATLEKWTPASLGFRIHLINADRCGLPSSYLFELVDDRGMRYPFQPAGTATERTAAGHMGATLHDDAVEGSFAVPVGAGTRFVVLQIRPIADRGCTAVDFRWDFQA